MSCQTIPQLSSGFLTMLQKMSFKSFHMTTPHVQKVWMIVRLMMKKMMERKEKRANDTKWICRSIQAVYILGM